MAHDHWDRLDLVLGIPFAIFALMQLGLVSSNVLGFDLAATVVSFSSGGESVTISIATIAALAHGQIDELGTTEHVHHIDGDRWHNQPENLEPRDPPVRADHHLNGRSLP